MPKSEENDGNGNVVSWVNATSGDLAAVYEYDPYGNLLRNEVIDSAIADAPFRFSTKYTDTETGWACYGYRYYAAPLGRFVNKDPIAEQGGLNLYGFVGNNGVNRWDYLGLTEADEEYKKAQAAQAAEKAAERRARAEAEDAARRAALRIYGVGGYLLHGGSGNAEVAAAYNNAYAANSQVTGTFTITASAPGGNVVSSLSVNITGSYNNVTTALGIAENAANAAIDSDRISQLSSSWSDDSSSGLAGVRQSGPSSHSVDLSAGADLLDVSETSLIHDGGTGYSVQRTLGVSNPTTSGYIMQHVVRAGPKDEHWEVWPVNLNGSTVSYPMGRSDSITFTNVAGHAVNSTQRVIVEAVWIPGYVLNPSDRWAPGGLFQSGDLLMTNQRPAGWPFGGDNFIARGSVEVRTPNSSTSSPRNVEATWVGANGPEILTTVLSPLR